MHILLENRTNFITEHLTIRLNTQFMQFALSALSDISKILLSFLKIICLTTFELSINRIYDRSLRAQKV